MTSAQMATPPRTASSLLRTSFCWRAGEITRLEAFCDVVFGFAITLLVVSLEVPRNYAELMADVRGFLPFAVCFAQLVQIWFTRSRFSRRYGLEDTYTVVLNVLPALPHFVLCLPPEVFIHNVCSPTSPTPRGCPRLTVTGLPSSCESIVWDLPPSSDCFPLCTITRTACGTSSAWTSMSKLLRLVLLLRENLVLMFVGLASFLVAFKSPAWAGWLYGSIGIFFWIHGSISGGRKRKLAARLHLARPVAAAVNAPR